MKKLILVSIASLLLSSTYENAEFMKPRIEECTKNGGHWKNGICKANWKSAKDICQASRGGLELPSVGELRLEIRRCSVLIGNYDKINQNDSQDYRSCYQKRGFSDNDGYWSMQDDSSDAWYVRVGRGDSFLKAKSDESYVLCSYGTRKRK